MFECFYRGHKRALDDLALRAGVCYPRWLLGTEVGFSVRVECVLNH